MAYWDVVCLTLEEEAKRMSIALGIPDVVGVIVIFLITAAVGFGSAVVFQVTNTHTHSLLLYFPVLSFVSFPYVWRRCSR